MVLATAGLPVIIEMGDNWKLLDAVAEAQGRK